MLRSSIVQILTPTRCADASLDPHPGRHRRAAIGDAEASAVASVIGAQASVVSGGLLTLAGLGAIAWRCPSSGGSTCEVAIADVSALGAEDAPIDAPAA